MNSLCESLDPFFDAELSEQEADAFRIHLATCADCGRRLHERTMLKVVSETPAPARLGERGAPGRGRGSVHFLRRIAPFVSSLAVAAGLLGVVVRGERVSQRADTEPAVVFETEAARGIEARFSYPAADIYRPYEVQRGGGSSLANDAVPMAALAKLEAAREFRGVAAGLALSGEGKKALSYLEKAPASPDVSSDRAALAVAEGRPGEALDLLDVVLRNHPDHPQALWNEALALSALRLPLVSAETWEKVAALSEPGWSAEARARALALRNAYDARRKSWEESSAACKALVRDGELPAPALLSQSPSMFRQCFYHATNVAASRDRLDALRPLARELDRGDASGPLSRRINRIGAAELSRRLPFQKRYLELYTDGATGGDQGAAQLIGELRAAGESDLLFGAIDLAMLWRDDARDLERIARSDPDPWLAIVAERARSKVHEAAGDYVAADRSIRSAIEKCDASRFDYLCARLAYQRVLVLLAAHRSAEADHEALLAMPRAEAYALPYTRMLREALATTAEWRNDFPLARAYAFDAMLRSHDACRGRVTAYELSAEGYLNNLDPESARRELMLGPPCKELFSPGDAFPLKRARELALLSRMGQELPESQHLPEKIDAARAFFSPGERIAADAIVGNLLLLSDHAAGAAMLASAVEKARALPHDSNAQQAKSWSTLALGYDAAARGDGASVIELFGAEAGLADLHCTLAVGADYERTFAVARGPGDADTVVTNPHAESYPPPLDTVVGAAIVERLRGCTDVRVLAAAPLFGTASLLPKELAWSYRVLGKRAGFPSALPPSRVVVSDALLPKELELPPLAGWKSAPPSDATTTWLHGAEATVPALLSAMKSATDVDIHTHGLVDVGQSDAPLLVLSSDSTGRWGLTANDIEATPLLGRPVVVLAACDAARPSFAQFGHFSLPVSFIHAGARAVIASAVAIPDSRAPEFFEGVRAGIREGKSPAVALRDERISFADKPGASWVSSVLLFE